MHSTNSIIYRSRVVDGWIEFENDAVDQVCIQSFVNVVVGASSVIPRCCPALGRSVPFRHVASESLAGYPGGDNTGVVVCRCGLAFSGLLLGFTFLLGIWGKRCVGVYPGIAYGTAGLG